MSGRASTAARAAARSRSKKLAAAGQVTTAAGAGQESPIRTSARQKAKTERNAEVLQGEKNAEAQRAAAAAAAAAAARAGGAKKKKKKGKKGKASAALRSPPLGGRSRARGGEPSSGNPRPRGRAKRGAPREDDDLLLGGYDEGESLDANSSIHALSESEEDDLLLTMEKEQREEEERLLAKASRRKEQEKLDGELAVVQAQRALQRARAAAAAERDAEAERVEEAKLKIEATRAAARLKIQKDKDEQKERTETAKLERKALENKERLAHAEGLAFIKKKTGDAELRRKQEEADMKERDVLRVRKTMETRMESASIAGIKNHAMRTSAIESFKNSQPGGPLPLPSAAAPAPAPKEAARPRSSKAFAEGIRRSASSHSSAARAAPVRDGGGFDLSFHSTGLRTTSIPVNSGRWQQPHHQPFLDQDPQTLYDQDQQQQQRLFDQQQQQQRFSDQQQQQQMFFDPQQQQQQQRRQQQQQRRQQQQFLMPPPRWRQNELLEELIEQRASQRRAAFQPRVSAPRRGGDTMRPPLSRSPFPSPSRQREAAMADRFARGASLAHAAGPSCEPTEQLMLATLRPSATMTYDETVPLGGPAVEVGRDGEYLSRDRAAVPPAAGSATWTHRSSSASSSAPVRTPLPRPLPRGGMG